MFNETPEYLKQEEEKYADCIDNLKREYGIILLDDLNYDDSDGDLEAIIQYMKNKNGKTADMMAHAGEACVGPCNNYGGENSIDICLKVTDTNLEIRNDIKLIFGILFYADECDDIFYAREVCHGTYKDFRTAILASSMKDKYKFLYFFNFAMALNLLIPYGCHDGSIAVKYFTDFNRLKCV